MEAFCYGGCKDRYIVEQLWRSSRLHDSNVARRWQVLPHTQDALGHVRRCLLCSCDKHGHIGADRLAGRSPKGSGCAEGGCAHSSRKHRSG